MRRDSVIVPEIMSVFYKPLCLCSGDKYTSIALTYQIGLIVGGVQPVFHWPGSACDGWGEPEPYFSNRLVPGTMLNLGSKVERKVKQGILGENVNTTIAIPTVH